MHFLSKLPNPHIVFTNKDINNAVSFSKNPLYFLKRIMGLHTSMKPWEKSKSFQCNK